MVDVHHRHHFLAVEQLVLRVLGLELFHPRSLKVKSIQQVARIVRIERLLVEYLRNHAVGMVVSPLVDHVHCLAVVEIADFGCYIVVLQRRLHKGGLELDVPPLVHIDGVGNAHFRCLVKLRCLVQHLTAEGVDGFSSGFSEAQGFVNLFLRLSGCTIVQHTECVGNAQRRQHLAVTRTCRAEQVEGEVVVLLHQLLLFLRQADGATRVVYRLTHILAHEEDGPRTLLADDVEEWAVSNKCCTLRCAVLRANHRHGSSLRAFLVKLDLRHLLHQVNLHIDALRLIVTAIAQFVEALTAKGVGHTQLHHDFLQVDVGLGLEFRERQTYIVNLIGIGIPVLAIQFVEHIVNTLVPSRQEHRHLVGTITVRQDDAFIGTAPEVAELSLHRHHVTPKVCVIVEKSSVGVPLVKLLLPHTLEVEGIEQIGDGRGVELIGRQHLFNHPLGVVAAPLVDDVECLSVAEAALLGCGVVVLCRLLREVFLQVYTKILVHVDGVGNVHLRFLVECAALLQQLAT